METVVIFYGHLEYSMYGHLVVYLVVFWYILPRFSIYL
jgi:hypothetical protein